MNARARLYLCLILFEKILFTTVNPRIILPNLYSFRPQEDLAPLTSQPAKKVITARCVKVNHMRKYRKPVLAGTKMDGK
jgi:hypothetical protein